MKFMFGTNDAGEYIFIIDGLPEKMLTERSCNSDDTSIRVAINRDGRSDVVFLPSRLYQHNHWIGEKVVLSEKDMIDIIKEAL